MAVSQIQSDHLQRAPYLEVFRCTVVKVCVIVKENRGLPPRVAVLVFSGNLDAARPDFCNRPRPVGDVGSYVRRNLLAAALGA